MVRTAFPDILFTHDEVIASGDMVAAQGLWTGTHNGPIFGLEATGRSCRIRGMVLWRIVDGALADRWAVLDFDALVAQIQGEQ